MTIHARRQINVRKQTMLLDRVDVGPPKPRTCWSGLNRSIHEAMINISNVKVHLKTCSGNANIRKQNNHNFIRKKICSSGPAYFFLLFFFFSRRSLRVQRYSKKRIAFYCDMVNLYYDTYCNTPGIFISVYYCP